MWLRISLLLVIGAVLQPAPVMAQDQTGLVGDYCLTGVMEVGSCIRLSPGGKFEYFLAYGAYDENAQGTWRAEGAAVVLDTPAYEGARPLLSSVCRRARVTSLR